MDNKRAHIIAALGTLFFLLLTFLFLWFVYVNAPQLEEEEGIVVAFGNAEDGGGYNNQPASALPTETTAPPPLPQTPSDNPLLTQDDPSPALTNQQALEEQRRQAEQQELIRKKQEAEAQAEAERIAKEQALAEKRAKEQQAIDNASRLAGLFGNKPTESEGSGTTTGSTSKGNPVGQGSSGGHDWSLNGRRLNSSLGRPKAEGTQEGKVVVEIRVNAQGKVIDYRIGQGTEISEKTTRQAAMDAARKVVFSEGKGEVTGTITYYFENK